MQDTGYTVAAIGLISCFTAAIATWAVGRWATRTEFFDLPGGRKGHGRPVPLGGGLAIAAAFGFTLGLIQGGRHEGLRALWDWPRDWPTVLAGGIAILIMGLRDDRVPLKPHQKLAWQLAVALAVVILGPRATVFSSSWWPGASLSVLWLLVMMNSFNFLDNMDGVAAGMAGITGGLFMIIAALTGQRELTWLLAALTGACAGFLLFNFPPARIFMGDAGSQFLGYLLGCATILFTFYRPGQSRTSIVLPVLIFAIPLYDFATIVYLRCRRGIPPWRGDRNHFSHRLRGLGLSDRQVALFVYLITLTVGLPALLLLKVSGMFALLLFLHTCAVLLVIFILEQKGREAEG